MKPKNRIKRWGSLVMALFLAITLLSGVYGVFVPTKSNAVVAPIGGGGTATTSSVQTVSGSTLECVPQISVGDAQSTLLAVIRDATNGTNNNYLPTIARLSQSGDGKAAFSDVYDHNGVVTISFSDVGDPKGTTNNFAACNSSMVLVRQIGVADQDTFYGVWKCAGPGPDYATTVSGCPFDNQSDNPRIKTFTATVDPAAGTLTMVWPGGKNLADETAVVKISDPQKLLSNVSYFGGTGTQTVTACLIQNQNGNIQSCLDQKSASFMDTAHIYYDGNTYEAGNWGGDDIYYTLVANSSNTDLGGLQPRFDVLTTPKDGRSAIDLNIDGDGTDINQLKDLKNTLAGGKNYNVKFELGNGKSGNVMTYEGTGFGTINQIANYYPQGGDGSQDTISLVFTNGAGGNESHFYGTYAYTGTDSNGATFTLSGKGYNCGPNEMPRFVIKEIPIEALEDGTHSISATWYVQANSSPCQEEPIPVSLAVEALGTQAPDADDTTTSDSLDCGFDDWNWVACPVITIAMKAVNTLDGLVAKALTVDINKTFGDSYYVAWNSFRIMGTALLVIIGLIMVASQALGLEFLDAYTIRKTLPRLLMAIIVMSLSWPLMKFAVGFFNTLGNDVYGLVVGPFTGLNAHVSNAYGSIASLGLLGAGALAVYLNVLGPASLLVIVSAVGGLLIAFLIMFLRQAIGIPFLAITAPIAAVCSILPGTRAVTKIWVDNSSGLMWMFPLIMLMLGLGDAFALVALKSGGPLAETTAFAAKILPFFFFLWAIRTVSGFVGALSAKVNDSTKGLFDRARNARQEAAGKRRERRGRNLLAKRADWTSRLQKAAGNKKRGWMGRQALYGASRALGGYNVQAASSARYAAVNKEMQDQIANGDDSEIRALTAYESGGKWYTLAGKETDAATVRRAKARWGNDFYAQQAALSYEMSKASTEEELQSVSRNYGTVARGWGMNDSRADSAWTGAAFANQHTHLEYKNMKGGLGQRTMDHKGYQNFVSEIYEKRGSYNMAQMGSNTIEELKNAYRSAGVNKDYDTQMKIEGIAETFMHEYSGSTIGQASTGQPITTSGGGGTRQANTPGAAHTAERVVELADLVGVGSSGSSPSGYYAPGHAPTINRREQK